jgi:hypothetical protein
VLLPRRAARLGGGAWALICASATPALAAAPDVAGDATGQRWHAAEITLVADPSLAVLGVRPERLVEDAVSAWRGASAELPRVRVERGRALGRAARDGVNRVVLAPIDLEGHRGALGVTLAWVDGAGEIVEADVILHARMPLRVLGSNEAFDVPTARSASCEGVDTRRACGDAWDAPSVLTHELGHFFGLDERPEDPTATMFPCTSRCETHKRAPTLAEHQELAALYTPAEDRQNASCATTPRRRGAGGFSAVSAAILAALLRRRARWREGAR